MLPAEYIYKLLVAFMVSSGLSYIIVAKNKNLLSIRFLSLYYTLQLLFILFYLLSIPEARGLGRQGNKYFLRDSVDMIVAVYLFLQLTILFTLVLLRKMLPSIRSLPDLVDIIKLKPKMIEVASIFFALTFLAYPYSKIGAGIGYAVAIIFNYAQFMPFIAGVTFRWNKFSSILWIISLSNLFFLGMVSGSRGTALFGLVCFAIGFFYALRSTYQKKLYVSLLLIIALPLTTVLSIVGNLRDTIGRASFEEIDAAYIKKAFRVYQVAQRTNILKSKKLKKNLSEQGVGRYVNLVNMTTLLTVPNDYPHIGFKDLEVDLGYIFDLAFISGSTPEDVLRDKALNFRLNDFGYALNIKYSVEYSIVTDAWIRFAWAGVFFFIFIYTFLVSLIEIAIRSFWKRIPTFVVIATLCLCFSAFFSYAYTIWFNLRVIVLGTFYAIAICFVIYLLLVFIYGKKIKYNFL